MISTALLRREVHHLERSRAPLVVLAIFVAFSVAVAVAAPWRSASPTPTIEEYRPSQVELTRVMLQVYAELAFASWQRDNPARRCPDHLRELNNYNDRARVDDTTDAWGHELRMFCGAFGLRVWSIGKDGRNNTADDLRSWD